MAIGLLPVGSASAATTGSGGGGNGGYDCYRYPSNRSDARWDHCCNRDWRDRPSWCWNDNGRGGNGDRHDWGRWDHANWNDYGRGGNGDWRDRGDGGRGGNGDWHDNGNWN
ncbi:hypothetical protein SF23_07215, partial [Streptomyces sp. MBRL 10]